MRLEPGRHKGFLEMHIEQGTQLENAGLRIGVVTGIVAIWQWRIAVEGQQDHAGGTTMAERKDAGLTAVRLLAAIDAGIPARLRRAQHLDHRAHRAGSRRAQHHPRHRRRCCSSSATSSMPVLERMEATLRALVQESNRRERCTRHAWRRSRKAMPALCDPAMMAALGGRGRGAGARRLAAHAVRRGT